MLPALARRLSVTPPNRCRKGCLRVGVALAISRHHPAIRASHTRSRPQGPKQVVLGATSHKLLLYHLTRCAGTERLGNRTLFLQPRLDTQHGC